MHATQIQKPAHLAVTGIEPINPKAVILELAFGIESEVFHPKSGAFGRVEGVYFDGLNLTYHVGGEDFEVNSLIDRADLDACPCCETRSLYRGDCYACGLSLDDEINPALTAAERNGHSVFTRK